VSGDCEGVMVMLANNTGWDAGVLYGRYGDRVGHLYSIVGARKPRFMPKYALDNGRFPCWSTGNAWDEAAFRSLLESHGRDALWVLVPDVVADRIATISEWYKWHPELGQYVLAFAVQDDMTAADVPDGAEVVFVGGTTKWKRKTLRYWTDNFPRVHVGRINTERWLWECHDAGVESCDGTGWFRGDPVQLRGLERFLRRSSEGLGPRQATLFPGAGSNGDSAGTTRAAVSKAAGHEHPCEDDAG
jgi:hypothetical protein